MILDSKIKEPLLAAVKDDAVVRFFGFNAIEVELGSMFW